MGDPKKNKQTKRSRNHRKANPVLTDANKPVINALRDNLQGNKIWICKDDTLEVNRKPLEGFVCTPGEGVTAEEHTRVLLSAINSMLSASDDAEKVINAVLTEDGGGMKMDNLSIIPEEIFEDLKEISIYPDLSDPSMWKDVAKFSMPDNFVRRLAEQYSIEQRIAATWTMDYLKYMYIKALFPTSIPSENIGKVCRLHTQYTKSYGALCGILENRIPYEPLDTVHRARQHTEYARTQNRYHSEFGIPTKSTSWNGCESLVVEKSVDPGRFWILKKFWKR